MNEPGGGGGDSSGIPTSLIEKWFLLEADEQELAGMVTAALAGGRLAQEGAWRRYQATAAVLLPEVRLGEMSVAEVHAVALHAAEGRS